MLYLSPPHERDDVFSSDKKGIRTEYIDGTTVSYIRWAEAVRITRRYSNRRQIRQRIFRVETSNGNIFDFHESAAATVWAEICYRYTGIAMNLGSESIPVELAGDGKVPTAAYLCVVSGGDDELSISSTADELGVTEATIKQYLSDFVHARR